MPSFLNKNAGANLTAKKIEALDSRLKAMERDFGCLYRAFGAFAEEMAKSAFPEKSDFAASDAASPEIAATELASLRQERDEFAKAAQSLQEQLAEAQSAKDELAERLTAQLADARKEADAARAEMASSRKEMARLAAAEVPGQAKLRQLWQNLENLPEAEKAIASAYYDLNSLAAFLAGVGQFARLEQLWDASAKKIREGQPLPAMPGFMAMILAIYNQANPDSKSACVEARIGANYDYMAAERVGRNGTLVASILLPGLFLPNGRLSRKCLVTLK